jgi:hypothetical protein
VHLEGELSRPWVQAKDVIVELLRRLRCAAAWAACVRAHGAGGGDAVGPGARDDGEHDRGASARPSALFGPAERTREWLRLQRREEDVRELATFIVAITDTEYRAVVIST